MKGLPTLGDFVWLLTVENDLVLEKAPCGRELLSNLPTGEGIP